MANFHFLSIDLCITSDQLINFVSNAPELKTLKVKLNQKDLRDLGIFSRKRIEITEDMEGADNEIRPNSLEIQFGNLINAMDEYKNLEHIQYLRLVQEG